MGTHLGRTLQYLQPDQAELVNNSTGHQGVLLPAGVVVYNFVEGGVHVAQTFPLHLGSLPVTFGLSAFVFSGHAVFPSIYRSMKDRSQYPRMLDYTYVIVGLTGLCMGESCFALPLWLRQTPSKSLSVCLRCGVKPI